MKKKQLRTAEEYISGIRSGDRFMLGQAITLVESKKPAHRAIAAQIVSACHDLNRASFRVGVTGSPGAGKSTFIEVVGLKLIQQGHQLAVLTIDPSSQLTKGSILGDKTRMSGLATSEQAFIRPSPSGGTLGGVARTTKETIALCEAAGYDMVFVETVGVGQSEIAVHYMTDLFLLLLLPGAGDELQGIKKGVVEMADLLVVNKADGDRQQLAQHTRRAYANALKLFSSKEGAPPPQVLTCSALNGDGIDQVIEQLKLFKENSKNIHALRLEQEKYWLRKAIETGLRSTFFENEALMEALKKEEEKLSKGEVSSFEAAENLLQLYKEII